MTEEMSDMRLTIVSPGRTSSGGSAFSLNLGVELERLIGSQVSQMSVPPTGRIDIRAETATSSHVVFLGARVAPVDGISIFWPLNVAPLENHVAHLPHTSFRNHVRHRLLQPRLRKSVGRADGLVFGSFHARTLYMAKYPAAAELPFTVIRGGTPSLERPDPGFVRRTGGKRTILVVSHLYPYKGILEVIEAVALIHRELPEDVVVRVAGADRDPRYAKAVHKRVLELGLQNRVKIGVANPDEMKELYETALFAVFPSTCENAGSFALYDGLHFGVPTISSDRSSMPEMVTGAVDFVNPNDPHALGASMISVLNDDAHRDELSRQAMAWSDDAPTWAWRAERLVEFLTTVKRGSAG